VEDDPPELKEGRPGPADLELVRRYIALNRQAIQRTDGVEFSQALKRLLV